MKRLVQAAAGSLSLYLIIGSVLPNWTILADSKDPDGYTYYYNGGVARVRVRVLEGPWWLWPLNLLKADDHPQHRVELLVGQQLWSCHSIQGDSYRIKDALVQWNSDGSATVYLDSLPAYDYQRYEGLAKRP